MRINLPGDRYIAYDGKNIWWGYVSGDTIAALLFPFIIAASIITIAASFMRNLVIYTIFPNFGYIGAALTLIAYIITMCNKKHRTVSNLFGALLSLAIVTAICFWFTRTHYSGETFLLWLFGYLPNLVCCCIIALTAGIYSAVFRRNKPTAGHTVALCGILVLLFMTLLKTMFGSDEGVSDLGNNFIGIVIVFPIQLVVTLLASLMSAAPGLLILSRFNSAIVRENEPTESRETNYAI